MMLLMTVLFQLFALLVCVIAQLQSQDGLADIITCELHNLVPNRYLVKLRRRHTLDDHFKHLNISKDHPHVKDINDHTAFIQAYSGKFSKDFVNRIRTDPGVERVTQDHFVRPSRIEIHHEYNTSKVQEPMQSEEERAGIWRRGLIPTRLLKVKTQHNAPWNLALLSAKNSYRTKEERKKTRSRDYSYLRNPGKYVDIYVASAGMIKSDHPELRGRTNRLSSLSEDFRFMDMDEDRHKTLFASVAAGTSFGVAKSANIIDMPNVDSVGGFIVALQDIVKQHNENNNNPEKAKKWRGSVVLTNVISSCELPDLWQAVRDAIIAGVVIVAHPGKITRRTDYYTDSKEPQYPCAYFGVLCVTAMDKMIEVARWARHGPTVNLMAPGVDIKARSLDDERTLSLKGTEFAASHVAGVVAMYMGNEELRRDVPKIHLRIKNNAKVAWKGSSYFAVVLNSLPTYILNNGVGSITNIFSGELYYSGIEPPQMQQTRSFRDWLAEANMPSNRLGRRSPTNGNVNGDDDEDNTSGGLRDSGVAGSSLEQGYRCTSKSALGYIGDAETIMYGLYLARGQRACVDISMAQWGKPQAIGACSGGLCPYLKVQRCNPPPYSPDQRPQYVALTPTSLARRDNEDPNRSPKFSYVPSATSGTDAEPSPTHSCLPDTIRLRAAAELIYQQCKSSSRKYWLSERVAGWSTIRKDGQCVMKFGIANGDSETGMPIM